MRALTNVPGIDSESGSIILAPTWPGLYEAWPVLTPKPSTPLNAVLNSMRTALE